MKVTLAGPDDLGNWFLHDDNGNAFPLVERWADHPAAAALFGREASDDVEGQDDQIENALLWLMEHIGDEIEAPKDIAKFFRELNG